MPPDQNDQNILIGHMWFNYYEDHTKDLIVFNIKERKEVKRISGHKKFPTYAFWADESSKAITSTGQREIICWQTSDWSILFKLDGKSSVFWLDHYNLGGIVIENTIKFWN